MTYKDLRIELHKNHYCEATLNDIAAGIASRLGCVDSYSANSASSQIELHLNTDSPSECDFGSAVMPTLIEFINGIGLEYEGDLINMYNILISHVEGNKSTVIIML